MFQKGVVHFQYNVDAQGHVCMDLCAWVFFIISIHSSLFSIPLYFVNHLSFIGKLSPLPVVFSRKGFHVNLLFISLLHISLLCH